MIVTVGDQHRIWPCPGIHPLHIRGYLPNNFQILCMSLLGDWRKVV